MITFKEWQAYSKKSEDSIKLWARLKYVILQNSTRNSLNCMYFKTRIFNLIQIKILIKNQSYHERYVFLLINNILLFQIIVINNKNTKSILGILSINFKNSRGLNDDAFNKIFNSKIMFRTKESLIVK